MHRVLQKPAKESIRIDFSKVRNVWWFAKTTKVWHPLEDLKIDGRKELETIGSLVASHTDAPMDFDAICRSSHLSGSQI